jgi:hypothetical protein
MIVKPIVSEMENWETCVMCGQRISHESFHMSYTYARSFVAHHGCARKMARHMTMDVFEIDKMRELGKI